MKGTNEYPKNTPIVLLSTEFSTYLENPQNDPSSKFTDISLLVNGTDYYHLECQMENDSNMTIRMVSYDMHFAMQHCRSKDEETNEMILHFPKSVVIYPDNNKNIPDKLICRIYFPDNSEHIYKIPTVRIQSYSLAEIREKHLILFLPYALLRLRPRLTSVKNPLTKEELTEFVNDIIFILDEAFCNGYITELQYNDYVNLFRFAADQIFRNYPILKKEVTHMTDSIIVLPSMIFKKQEAEIKEKDEMLNIKDELLNEKDDLLNEKEAQIDAMALKIKELEQRLAEKNFH